MPNQPYTGDGKGKGHPFIRAAQILFRHGKDTKGLREGRGRIIGDVGQKQGKHRKEK